MGRHAPPLPPSDVITLVLPKLVNITRILFLNWGIRYPSTDTNWCVPARGVAAPVEPVNESVAAPRSLRATDKLQRKKRSVGGCVEKQKHDQSVV